MSMLHSLRKPLLAAHIVASIGWLGAVASFLALAVFGLRSTDAQMVRALATAQDPLAWWVLLPLCLASLVTGLASSLVTPWGLLRHYWVLFKLAITVISTGLLLLHLPPIDYLARRAADPDFAVGSDLPVRIKLATAAGAAVLALLLAIVLSVYKPKGLTPYGQRLWFQRLQRASVNEEAA